MNIRCGIFLLTLLFTSSPLLAADRPSVLIETAPLKQQAMLDTVSGYGVVSPGTSSLKTISLPRPGQVVSLLVAIGQVVKKNTPLLAFSTSPDATLLYQQARQNVIFAQGEAARIEQLLSQQLATQSQLALAKKALADAQAGLRLQTSIGAERSIEHIVAPFDGVIVALPAAQGDRLLAGAPVLQLARSGEQRVLIGTEPEDISRVQPGMPVRLISVLGNGVEVTGKVMQVFGMINPQTQLVDVLVSIPGGGLISGMRVRAEIAISRQMQWVVPRTAVLNDAQGAYLFQVNSGKAHRVNITTGIEQNGMIAIRGTFSPQQAVVTLGNYELQDGMAVREGSQP